MPDVRLPNGQIVRNVPEGTSRSDLASRLFKAGKINQDEFSEMAPRAALDASLSTGERLLIGTGRGFIDALEGAQQLGLEAGEFLGLVRPERVQRFTQQAQQERDLFERGDLGVAGTVGRIGGNVAAGIGAGGAIGAAGRAAGAAIPALGRAGQAIGNVATRTAPRRALTAAGGGAAGGASTFVPEGGSRTTQAAFGAIGGAVGEPIIRGLSKSLAQIPMRRIGRAATRRFRANAARQALQGRVPDDALDGIANDIADGLTPEQAIRKADIEFLGATPTRGRVSGQAGDLAFEVRAGRAQEDAGQEVLALQEVIQDNKKAVLQKANQIADEFGPASRQTPEAVGERAASRLRTAQRRTQTQVVSPAFDRAADNLAQFGDDLDIPMSRVVAGLNDEVDNLQGPDMAGLRNALSDFGLISREGDRFAITGDITLTPQRAEVLRRRLGKIKGGDAGRVASKVMRTMEGDIKDGVGVDVYESARRISKETFFDEFVNPARTRAVIDGDVAPEDIVPSIQTRWKNNEVRKFFNTLDRVAPQTAKDVRGAVMRDIQRKLSGQAVDVEGLPELTLATFNKRLQDIGDEKLNAIFGEGTARLVRRFGQAAQRLGSVDRRAAGSPTAPNLVNTLEGAGFALYNRVPLLGNLLITASRIIGRNVADANTRRRARQALNMTLLKNENALNDILTRLSSPTSAFVAGQQAAQQEPAVRGRVNEVLGIQNGPAQ